MTAPAEENMTGWQKRQRMAQETASSAAEKFSLGPEALTIHIALLLTPKSPLVWEDIRGHIKLSAARAWHGVSELERAGIIKMLPYPSFRVALYLVKRT